MKATFLLICTLSVAAISHATIRYVSSAGTSPYASIAAAYAASVAGDTIMIGPGTYSESGPSAARRLHWMGAGFDLSILNLSGAFSLNAAASGSIVEGLRILGGGPVINCSSADSITVRRCILRATLGTAATLATSGAAIFQDCVLIVAPSSPFGGAVVSVSAGAGDGAVFRECVFTHLNPTAGASASLSGINGGAIEVYNSVFLNFNRLFSLTGSQPLIAVNNIAIDWVLGSPSWGTYLPGSAVDYIAADNTAPAFPGTFTNTIALAANNPFVNYAAGSNYVIGTTDLHLTGTGGALLTDTGHPSIYDIDSSRSDLGIYGGPLPFVDNGAPPYPFTTSMSIPSLIGIADSVNTSSSGRIGPRY